MSTEKPPLNDVGQNQQVTSKIIQFLSTVIPLLIAVSGGLIAMSQRRMEIQIPISATQTAEARQLLAAIATSNIETVFPNATASTVISQIDNVEVVLNNPNTDSPSVHLIIKQDDAVIADLILPPGGTAPKINLPSGSYQVEARPIYPPITPQSANCQIRWQVAESYKRDLVITSGEAVIQIQQFDFEPQEICFTETPVP